MPDLCSPWLLQVREMIREELDARVTLAGLCRSVGRHPVHLSREFHRHFSCTISEYLRRVRIAKAQSLLALRDLEVAKIALACGFSDQSHFTNEFRRITGLPPRRCRLQLFGKPSIKSFPDFTRSVGVGEIRDRTKAPR